MNLIENVVEIYWDNTTEGESLSTPNNEYKIVDDQTTVAEYYVHNNADETFEVFGDIEDALASIPHKLLQEIVEHYKG